MNVERVCYEDCSAGEVSYQYRGTGYSVGIEGDNSLQEVGRQMSDRDANNCCLVCGREMFVSQFGDKAG